MNENIENSTKEVTEFTEKTRREVRLWDWLGRVLPLIALVIVTVAHYSDFHSIRDMIINIGAVIFVSVCFIWWYWALRKIVSSVKYIQRAHEKFIEVAQELRNIKKDINKDDSNR